jgi:hypothetical protein
MRRIAIAFVLLLLAMSSPRPGHAIAEVNVPLQPATIASSCSSEPHARFRTHSLV